MPIFEISYNDYDETWETYQADWEDDSRVFDAVAIHTYSRPWPSKEVQTDYSVFVKRAIIESAFVEGVRLVKEKINAGVV